VPCWHDILKYSANGNLHQMRAAAAALEATLEDEDEVNEARDVVRSQLGLAEPIDPVGARIAQSRRQMPSYARPTTIPA
jgi:hypothetical protein